MFFPKSLIDNQATDCVTLSLIKQKTEFPLLANGSYKIKIRVLWMVFRHRISDVRLCSEKSTAKQKSWFCAVCGF